MPVQTSAVAQYADEYWSTLTDAQLLQITWEIGTPNTLTNIQPTIPDDLGAFMIEVEYHIGEEGEPARCAHCPQHQRHRHGYVLLADDGRRFLLGSKCGPKAYHADLMAATEARKRAKKRFEALERFQHLREALPDLIDSLAEAVETRSFKAVRRARGEFSNCAPELLARLRLKTRDGELDVAMTSVRKFRDTEAEQLRIAEFQRQAAELANIPGTKKHRAAMAELRAKVGPLGEIWRVDHMNFGVLRGLKVMITRVAPHKTVEAALSQLRGILARDLPTDGRSNGTLRQECRVIELCVDGAVGALALIRSANEFFSPENLKAFADWAATEFEVVKVAQAQDHTLTLKEQGQLRNAVLTIGPDWQPPGGTFLEQATALALASRH